MSDSASARAGPRTPPISISSTSTEVNRTGSWKYIRPVYVDRSGPCQAACPTGIDIPAYMALLRAGRTSAACAEILRHNPLPAITGRVCDHPCEASCNRAQYDGAVAVHAVERMLGDEILAQPAPPPLTVVHEEKIAVVGSGPAGLACAYHLSKYGYRTEVFEQDDLPGGMLRSGIPEYRLPRDILDRQIDWLRALGVRIHCGQRIDGAVSWAELTAEFSAVFIATGAHISRGPSFVLPATHAIWSGLYFLRQVNRGERPPVGEHVVVIGGGNTAMDCARTALRLGATVTIAYRRTRAEMPALPEEIAEAEQEGVRFLYLASPIAVRKAGASLFVTFEPMTLGHADASGRRQPIRDELPCFEVACDTLITAIGEDAELGVLPTGADRAQDSWGATEIANLFIGGDAVSTARTVASALGAGLRAAAAIHEYLGSCRGDDVLLEDRTRPEHEAVPADNVNLNHFGRVARHRDRRSHRALPFTETNLGLARADALAEAARCFECGACNSCELCLIYCADAAIKRGSDGTRFEIMLDYCKGCGVCATECPRGAIVMTREGL